MRNKIPRRKWKFSAKAKHRECELCGKKLLLDEHFYCKMCWDSVLYGNGENDSR
ncbi:MAG: hypothetical protein NT001_00770 [Candidatus Woesearchaeota archaeon]|nr:hypothetical protein [Candidatus Woesearchaeota archaeon]